MALQRVRHASIFVQGKKIGEMFKNKISHNSGDEQQFGDDGAIGMSDGSITTTFDFDAFVPVAQPSYDPRTVFLQKLDVDVTVGPIGGKLHQLTMRFMKCEYDSDSKGGTLNGTFQLQGGTPSFV